MRCNVTSAYQKCTQSINPGGQHLCCPPHPPSWRDTQKIGHPRYVSTKSAKGVAAATSKLLKPLSAMISTITYDNGLEFAAHLKIARALDAKTFFANPYSSCERATNENTNGLIRQYLPKKTSFENLTKQQVEFIEHRLNHRPRKCLDYQTPYEVFSRSAKKRGVALRA